MLCPEHAPGMLDDAQSNAPLLSFPNQQKQNGADAPSSSRHKTRREKIDVLETWFDTEFLPRYPEKHRTTQRKTALRELQKLNPDADARAQALEMLEAWKRNPDFIAYPCGPGKFFEDGKFKNAPPAAGSDGLGPTYQDARKYWERG
jgi:hypothetical protein